MIRFSARTLPPLWENGWILGRQSACSTRVSRHGSLQYQSRILSFAFLSLATAQAINVVFGKQVLKRPGQNVASGQLPADDEDCSGVSASALLSGILTIFFFRPISKFDLLITSLNLAPTYDSTRTFVTHDQDQGLVLFAPSLVDQKYHVRGCRGWRLEHY